MSQNKKLRNAIVTILQAGHGVDMRADLSVYPSEGSFLVECFLGEEELNLEGLSEDQAQQAAEASEIADYFPSAEEAADCYLALCEWLEKALLASTPPPPASPPPKARKEAPAPVPLPAGLSDLTTADLEELDAGVAVVVVLSPLAANDRGQLPVLETLVRAYPDVHFGRIDMLENPEVVSRFQVTASPVCLIFKDGQLVRQLSGMQSEKALRGVLDGLAG